MRLLTALCALAAGTSAAAACPDHALDATFGDLELVADFLPDPVVRLLAAGGPIDLASCPEIGLSGYVAEAPDLRFIYSESFGGPLTIGAVSLTGVDLILIVNDPDGDWHVDDDSGFGTNPVVTIEGAPDGVYDIWVGTFNEGAKEAALLMFTESD